jgi:hypothetical protein
VEWIQLAQYRAKWQALVKKGNEDLGPKQQKISLPVASLLTFQEGL